MVAQGELQGYLYADIEGAFGRFHEPVRDSLTMLAAQAAVALANIRVTEGLECKLAERTAELSESLAYQTAISEVLRVISESPTEVSPVLEVILDCATRLVQPQLASIFRYDGRLIHVIATRNWTPLMTEEASALFPIPADERSIAGRAILARKTIMVEDVLSDPQYGLGQIAKAGRRIMSAPMLKDGVPVGALSVAWADPGQTPQRQIDLLKTFADQAVIAIENVRLFNETQEALERQTATSEVLQVISSSVSDTAPVFDKILDSCERLFATDQLGIYLVQDDAQVHVGAVRGSAIQAMGAAHLPKPIDQTATGLAIRERLTVYIPDAAALPDAPPPSATPSRRLATIRVSSRRCCGKSTASARSASCGSRRARSPIRRSRCCAPSLTRR